MARDSVLRHILHQDETLNPNSMLLKKFILCIHHGWFRINGCSPDNQFSLADYLLDNERIVFDFTRLSEKTKEEFLNWFSRPHHEDTYRAYLTGVTTNDYRGYTAEVGLSWWGRITNLLFYKKQSFLWNLSPLELTLDYQLNGIEICEGEHGLLIGLNQFAVDDIEGKYQSPGDNQDEPLRNTKRLLLTDEIVSKLISSNLQTHNFVRMMANPHPYAINVPLPEKRYEEMKQYRKNQRFIPSDAWYKRIWQWISSFFNGSDSDIELKAHKFGDKNFKPLASLEKVQVFRRPNSGEVLIIEKRPELDSMVFCGGGAKIFAHVGAYKAFQDAKIKPTKFAGSSAGAIMAVLCYLGYSADEIFKFFQGFRQENIIHYDIDTSGLSDTQAVKAGLDFMITKKVNQILKKYNVDKNLEGQDFINNYLLKSGKITFASLNALKERYPDCELGEELIVTATNAEQHKTRYLSFKDTPSLELSKAVTMSASYPIVFKPTIFEGERHKDGGVLNNFPTNVFRDDRSTLLESEHGNCLSLVALQFDNGPERGILDKLSHRVYRESFLANKMYEWITGVNDPVGGWERDRLRLLQHSNQVVLIPIDNISATQFDMEPQLQMNLFNNGYDAAKNYIDIRYEQNSKEESACNQEYFYSNFASVEEALYFCCYRGQRQWFDFFADKAQKEGVSKDKVDTLRARHFKQHSESSFVEKVYDLENSVPLSNHLNGFIDKQTVITNMRLFEAIYPIFLKIPYEFIKNSHDLKLYKEARHSFSLRNPTTCLNLFKQINGKTHILFAVFLQLITNFQTSKSNIDDTCDKLNLFNSLLVPSEKFKHQSYFGNWNILDRHINRILYDIQRGHWKALIKLCNSLKNNEEPLQTIIHSPTLNDEELVDDGTDFLIAEQRHAGCEF